MNENADGVKSFGVVMSSTRQEYAFHGQHAGAGDGNTRRTRKQRIVAPAGAQDIRPAPGSASAFAGRTGL
jgi:hypothetical protein